MTIKIIFAAKCTTELPNFVLAVYLLTTEPWAHIYIYTATGITLQNFNTLRLLDLIFKLLQTDNDNFYTGGYLIFQM